MSRELVILMAEDDPGHVRLIEKNLRRAGISNAIESFPNGQEMLDFLRGFHPDRRCEDRPYLLLLDIHMPVMDGVEALREIKSDPLLRRLPVIMLTTTDDPREVRRCHDLGCGSYLVKPVEYDRFAEAIQRLGGFMTLVEVPELKTHEEP